MVDDQKPIGILGGTFNPIHFGHLRLALEIAQDIEFDHVRLIPTGNPPHRPTPRVSARVRLEMTKIAVEGNPGFKVDEREINRDGLCYTVDTLTELRTEFGATRSLCLLMGADAFLGLCGWHLWQRVFDLAHIIVAHRPGTSFDAWESAMPSALVQELRHRLTTDASALVNNAYGKILLQRITLLDLSSSAIRREIRRGRSVQYLLPDGVLDYIQRNRLYRDADED